MEDAEKDLSTYHVEGDLLHNPRPSAKLNSVKRTIRAKSVLFGTGYRDFQANTAGQASFL